MPDEIHVVCPCCGCEIPIGPNHPLYEEKKAEQLGQLMLLVHPEVSEEEIDDQC